MSNSQFAIETPYLKVGALGCCGEKLSGEDANPYRHQVVEIPPIKPDATRKILKLGFGLLYDP